MVLAALDPVDKFLRLLQQHAVIQNQPIGPSKKIIDLIVKRFQPI